MRKTRLIAITLVLALVLMGAGYAYWSEALAVNTTIKTGNMDVIFAPCGTDSEDYDNGHIAWWDNGEPFGEDSVDYLNVTVTPSNNNHKLTFKLQDLYPGSGGWMTFTIKNVGTVPAKLTDITKTVVSDTAGLQDDLQYKVDSIAYYNKAGIGVPVLSGVLTANNLNDFIDDLTNVLKTNQYTGSPLILEPGGWLQINAVETGYNIALPKTVTADALEGQTLEFDLGLNFVQCE